MISPQLTKGATRTTPSLAVDRRFLVVKNSNYFLVLLRIYGIIIERYGLDFSLVIIFTP